MAQVFNVATHVPLARQKTARRSSRVLRPAAPLALPEQAAPQVWPDTPGEHLDQQFMDMLKAYRPSGGLRRAPTMAARCKPHGGTDVRTLAGWIVHRKVVSFEWLSRIWLPVFQFQRADMTRQSGLEEVMAELVLVFDDWQIASWFALPNHWLGEATPADSLATAAPDVLQAARSERFLLAL